MHAALKKITTTILLLCSAFYLQGCFEVVEKLDMHTDGSGNFQFTINMSKSKTRVHSIMNMKTINGRPVPTKADIHQKIKEIENILKSSNGISNVSTTLDFENYIATLNCSFKKIEDLNNAAKKVAVKQKMKAEDISNSYAYNAGNKTFTRFSNFSLKGEYNKLGNADKEVFTNAFFTSILRFESEIKTATNSSGKISADKKAVMLRESVLDIVTEKKSIETKINLSN